MARGAADRCSADASARTLEQLNELLPVECLALGSGEVSRLNEASLDNIGK